MGTWHNLRMVFILGSLFMVLLIIVYWDDIGGFNRYPLQEQWHTSPPSDPHLQASSGTSPPSPTGRARKSFPSDVPTTASSKTLVLEDKGGTVEDQGEEQEEDGSLAAQDVVVEQEARKKRITDVCSGNNNVEFPGMTRTFEQIPNRELDHLIVDDTHQIIYCYVPKVACTNWKRVMVVLSQSLISPSGKPYTDPETISPDLVHNSSLYLTFAQFWRHYGSLSRHLMAVKLQQYTKFLFVRDPFVRLISAFRNKFGRPNEDFYRQFGSEILRRYGNASGGLPETAAEAFAAGIRPTFQQFVAYLLDPETERERIFNEHWRQVYRLCHPCQVKYDFIGQLETLETDAKHLLKLLEVDHLVHFPSGARNRTTTTWERDWFAQIPLTIRRELYKIYEPDFQLFGYPKPDSVLNK